jgi:hypothetical protein
VQYLTEVTNNEFCRPPLTARGRIRAKAEFGGLVPCVRIAMMRFDIPGRAGALPKSCGGAGRSLRTPRFHRARRGKSDAPVRIYRVRASRRITAECPLWPERSGQPGGRSDFVDRGRGEVRHVPPLGDGGLSPYHSVRRLFRAGDQAAREIWNFIVARDLGQVDHMSSKPGRHLRQEKQSAKQCSLRRGLTQETGIALSGGTVARKSPPPTAP